jgi:hypothetical protein
MARSELTAPIKNYLRCRVRLADRGKSLPQNAQPCRSLRLPPGGQSSRGGPLLVAAAGRSATGAASIRWDKAGLEEVGAGCCCWWASSHGLEKCRGYNRCSRCRRVRSPTGGGNNSRGGRGRAGSSGRARPGRWGRAGGSASRAGTPGYGVEGGDAVLDVGLSSA